MDPEKYARSLGVKIGKGYRIDSTNFGFEPFLIEIGDNVYITSGVSFVTHDGGVWVFTQEELDFAVFRRTKIGSNVHIGNNALILPGVSIGNKCVIGPCSVVKRSILDNSVIANSPCRFVCSIKDYHQ